MSETINSTHAITCSSCGAPLTINPNAETVTCEFCDSTYSVSELLHESDAIRIHKLEEKERKELEAMRQAERQRLEAQRRYEQEQNSSFKKGAFSKILLVLFFIALLFGIAMFADYYIISGLLSCVAALCFLFAWIIGMNYIKVKKQGIPTVLTIIALLLFIPFCCAVNDEEGYDGTDRSVSYTWPTSGLSEHIPQPSISTGKIDYDDLSTFEVTIYNASNEDFTSYINQAKAYGYTVEPETNSNSYVAHNTEGYKLDVYLYSNGDLEIELDSPKATGALTWPNTGLATKLPTPTSTVGTLDYYSNDNLRVYVGDTPLTEYSAYVNRCIAAGFDQNVSKSTTYFSAKNIENVHLTIEYDGANIMIIKMWASS